jgi:chorismate lyase / 3-hydroxybenzoate synthase
MFRLTANHDLLIGFNLADSVCEPTTNHELAYHPLGEICFEATSAANAKNVFNQHVQVKTLWPKSKKYKETFLSKKPTIKLQEEGVNCQHNGDILFGVIEIEELEKSEELDALSGGSTTASETLEKATEQAYVRVLALLDKHNYKYLWRTWNYIPSINAVTHGRERYQQFNAGRQKGFASAARDVIGNVPAACALGVQGRRLSIAFLAGRTPTLAIENPRQISAYHYPKQYGTMSPTFSRASLAWLNQQEFLLLSGTASIVGHETVHVGDVTKQTIESLANIEAIIMQANLSTRSKATYKLEDFCLRVYIRHENDFEAVKAVMDERLGLGHKALYLQADICRSDLDVEIEGVASHDLPAAVNASRVNPL